MTWVLVLFVYSQGATAINFVSLMECDSALRQIQKIQYGVNGVCISKSKQE